MSNETIRVPKLLSVRELSQLTGIQRWRLYELIARGEGPPTMRIGKTIRVPADALVRWIEERTKTSAAAER